MKCVFCNDMTMTSAIGQSVKTTQRTTAGIKRRYFTLVVQCLIDGVLIEQD